MERLDDHLSARSIAGHARNAHDAARTPGVARLKVDVRSIEANVDQAFVSRDDARRAAGGRQSPQRGGDGGAVGHIDVVEKVPIQKQAPRLNSVDEQRRRAAERDAPDLAAARVGKRAVVEIVVPWREPTRSAAQRATT